MDIIGYLILYISAFALFIVVGSFILIMMDTVFDAIYEQQQAKEREKRRN